MIRYEDLHTRATLVAVHITTWSARKFDREVTTKINDSHNLDHDVGRYNKRLLATGSNSWKELIKICSAARTSHYENTLAWSDDGYRLLPSANYDSYMKIMRKHESDFEAAKSRFVGDYPMLIDSARDYLVAEEDGGMFRASDYPPIGEVAERFTMRSTPLPVPTSGDFRVKLPESEIKALQKAVEEKVKASADEAVADARDRLVKVVESISDKLGEPDAIFRDSLINNARDLTDVLSRLNVMGDKELEAMRQRVESELAAVEPQTLRDEPTVRKQVAQSAKKILTDMNQYSRRVR